MQIIHWWRQWRRLRWESCILCGGETLATSDNDPTEQIMTTTKERMIHTECHWWPLITDPLHKSYLQTSGRHTGVHREEDTMLTSSTSSSGVYWVRAKMGSLVPGHQGTGALGPGPRAFFILFYFLFWREFFFSLKKSGKKIVFSLFFLSFSLSFSLSLYTHFGVFLV